MTLLRTLVRSWAANKRSVAGLQAGYLLTTGAWSIVHRRSFERITGEKYDYWLVRTVGGLAVVCGAALGSVVLRDTRSRETELLAGGQAIVFGLADIYAATHRSRSYLADLALQVACTPAWFGAWHDD